ncbi:MAG: amidohydrolase family protein [Rhodospirillales bacterium]|nr:amidohydrolase family protein [Rhodospirillales bacterium]
MFDIVFANGTVVDGTGAPAYQADVGVTGDRITAIGDLSSAEAGERLDVSGLHVSPGFIDIHTHSDAILLADGRADSQVYQGVTSEVVGQCGYSFAPVEDAERMAAWMPGRLPEVDVTWKTYDGYLNRLDDMELGVNVLGMLGHGTVHGAVLGDAMRQSTEDERAQMVRYVEAAMEEGAWGFTTGLEYWPGVGATTPELAELCFPVAKYDRLHASHVRNRDIFYDLGFAEVMAIGRVTGVRTQIAHIQPKYGRPDHAMAHTIDMIEHYRSIGVEVTCDVIPHEWSHTSVVSPLPSWAREGGAQALLERLRDPEMRQRMRHNPGQMWRLVTDEKWDRIILYYVHVNKDLIGKTVEEIGRIRGKDPFEAILDVLIEEGDDVLHAKWTSHNFFEDDLQMILKRPYCGVISDTYALTPGGPTGELIGSLAGYGWAARFLEHYVRDVGLMSLEEGIRRMTLLPASNLRLKDRGVLRAGAHADITVFDYDKVAFKCTVEEPRIHPDGFVHVMANGEFGLRQGWRTNINAGRVLRAA